MSGAVATETNRVLRLFETTRTTTAELLTEPSLAGEPELASALRGRLRRIDHTLAYNRCRAAVAERAPLRAVGELLGTPGALRFALGRALRGVGRRLRHRQDPERA